MIVEDKLVVQDKWGRVWEWRGEGLRLESDPPADFVPAPGTSPCPDRRAGKLPLEERVEMNRLEKEARQKANEGGSGYHFVEGHAPLRTKVACPTMWGGQGCIYEKGHIGRCMLDDNPKHELSIQGYDPYHPERSTLAYKMAKRASAAETENRVLARTERDERIVADLLSFQHTFQSIATKYNLTREAVRQISIKRLTPEQHKQVADLAMQ
jgi:DNA-directed RNA polymerase sigma subunit (sigma70/sigma32)